VIQTIALNTPKPIMFLLPDILAAWPYKELLHPDYGTVMSNPPTGSTIIISSARKLSDLLKNPFMVSDSMTGHCIQRFIILLKVSWVVAFSRALQEVFNLLDFTSKYLMVQSFLPFRL